MRVPGVRADEVRQREGVEEDVVAHRADVQSIEVCGRSDADHAAACEARRPGAAERGLGLVEEVKPFDVKGFFLLFNFFIYF